MQFFVLESGSKGNCSVIKSGGSFLIIDCGGTMKYLKNCFAEIGLDYREACGLLITHEHDDHIKQLKMFAALDIYAPCRLKGVELKEEVKPLKPFSAGPFRIMPLPLSHDCERTVGYIIFDGQETLVTVTDTGYLSEQNEKLIRNAHYYLFESNYDTGMLMASNRPSYLKARINSDWGHMENRAAARALSRVIGNRTREIVLAHLSQECNEEQLALKTLLETFRENGLNPEAYRIRAARQFEICQGGKTDE